MPNSESSGSASTPHKTKRLSLEKLMAIQQEIALLDRRISQVKKSIGDSTSQGELQLGDSTPTALLLSPFPAAGTQSPHRDPMQGSVRGLTGVASLQHVDLSIDDDASLRAMLAVEVCQVTAAGDVVSLRALLEGGADPNCADYDNATPLHIAAERGYVEVVELLLEHGASVNPTDDDGKTPAMIAGEHGFDAIRDLLMFRNISTVGNEPDSFLCASAPATMSAQLLSGHGMGGDSFEPNVNDNMVVVMVGLPGRGKTFIAKHIERYFNWNHYKCKCFAHQHFRKRATGTTASFPTHVPDAEILTSTLLATEINQYLTTGGNVAIIDGTNSTQLRRQTIRETLLEETGLPPTRIIFVEIFSNDKDLIMANVLLAKKGTRNPTPTFVEDYVRNMQEHEAVYKTLTPATDSDISFIRIENQVTYSLNRIDGWLQSRLAYMLHNLRHTAQTLYLTRAGEYEDLVSGRVGGNSRLSKRGEAYSKALYEFMKVESGGTPFVVLSSCATRCTQTVKYFVQAAHKNLEVVQDPPAPAHLPPPPLYHLGSNESIASSTNSQQNESLGTQHALHAEAEVNCRVAYFPTLDDLNHGDCEGQLWSDIHATLPNTMASMKADPYHVAWPNGESIDQLFTGRLEPHIHDIQASTQPLLVVSHSPLIQGFYAYFVLNDGCMIPAEEAHNIRIPLHTVIRIRNQVAELIDLGPRVAEIMSTTKSSPARRGSGVVSEGSVRLSESVEHPAGEVDAASFLTLHRGSNVFGI